MDFENNKADDEWEIYMGLLYSNIIKKELKNKELKNVVELAPGYRYKIAYALKQINFNGDLYVVDNNQDVLNYIKDSYNTILPNAKLHLICCDFDVCHFYLPNEIDLFLANHCIDDMIINEFTKSIKFTENVDYKNLLINCWDTLNSSTKQTNAILNKIYQNFLYLFKNKKINFVIMAQYRSNQYLKEVTNEYTISLKLFNKIKKLTDTDDDKLNKILEYHPFGSDERYLLDFLLNNTQTAKNWIAGKLKL